jgi:hypothetical protein
MHTAPNLSTLISKTNYNYRKFITRPADDRDGRNKSVMQQAFTEFKNIEHTRKQLCRIKQTWGQSMTHHAKNDLIGNGCGSMSKTYM